MAEKMIVLSNFNKILNEINDELLEKELFDIIEMYI